MPLPEGIQDSNWAKDGPHTHLPTEMHHTNTHEQLTAEVSQAGVQFGLCRQEDDLDKKLMQTV